MGTLLRNVQEVSGSIPGPTVRFLSSGELFQGLYGLSVSMFKFCPTLSSEEPLVLSMEARAAAKKALG